MEEEWKTEKEAKKCGTGAHVQVPKRFRGRKFKVELLEEEQSET